MFVELFSDWKDFVFNFSNWLFYLFSDRKSLITQKNCQCYEDEECKHFPVNGRKEKCQVLVWMRNENLSHCHASLPTSLDTKIAISMSVVSRAKSYKFHMVRKHNSEVEHYGLKILKLKPFYHAIWLWRTITNYQTNNHVSNISAMKRRNIAEMLRKFSNLSVGIAH